ncbi:MAG: GNAT family N-acetyltransferase [Promethearchaeota archaeon]|nr:MAG: GNAT family N-acetyltransferase [Candidatus Lokiarchaeota archaeon]
MTNTEKKEKITKIEEPEYFPFIKGTTIDLCPRNSKYANLYIRWKNNPKVRKYARNIIPRTIEDQKKRFETSPGGLTDHISLDIWHKKDKKLIGQIGLGHINWVSGWANAFLQIGEPDYWNKDIGTETTNLIAEYAFNELNLNKLHGGVAVDNIGSWSVAEKIGFKFEGIRKHEMYIDGRYVDTKVFRLLKEDWLKSKK